MQLPQVLRSSEPNDFTIFSIEEERLDSAMNKFFRMLLKTAIFVIDQSCERVDRASDGVSEMIDRGKAIIQPEDNRMRNVVSFAAGVGIGVGAAILFAPASGAETRSSISGKVREFRSEAV